MSKLVRTPELAELRAFCAAVDLGSLGKAARLLRVSQPALSKRLRALEALCGSRLLERSTRGVEPTAAGRELYEAARRLLSEAEAIEALMDGFGAEQAPVRLAVSPTMAEFVLPPLLVEFESRHDHHLSIELAIANSAAARSLTLEGRADLGLVAAGAGPSDGLCESPFCEDEIVIAVPETHPWAELDAVDPSALVSTPLIMRDPGASSRRVVSEGLEAQGLSPAPPLAEIGSTTAAIAAALSEGAPLLVSSLALDGPQGRGLETRRVAGLSFPRRFVLIHGGEESLPPAAKALAHHLLASVASGS
ncbi:MAG: LysR substrate-binding domain-containing protein [Solirubrobacterales bacterium]